MRARIPRLAAAFSLVEVTLALGICAFALISILVLLPVSLNSAQLATEISRCSKAIEYVASELSQSRFSSVAALAGAPKVWTFDYDGIPTEDPQAVYFLVEAIVMTDARLLPGEPRPTANVLRVALSAKIRDQPATQRAAIIVADVGY